MSRDLTGGMASEIAKPELAPAVFVKLDFESGFVRVWHGVGPIVWDAQTWLGGGNLIGISEMEETREVEATALSLTMTGFNPALVSQIYGDFSQGRAAQIWLGAIDPRTAQIVSDPAPVFAGRMDTIGDEDAGAVATITVSVESNLTDLKRVRARYLTDQDQQRFYPDDRSLRYIPALQDVPIYWGIEGNTPDVQKLA